MKLFPRSCVLLPQAASGYCTTFKIHIVSCSLNWHNKKAAPRQAHGIMGNTWETEMTDGAVKSEVQVYVSDCWSALEQHAETQSGNSWLK